MINKLLAHASMFVLITVSLWGASQTQRASRPAVVEGLVANQLTGAPISGARLLWRSEAGLSWTLITDDEGRFKSDALAAGRYRILLSATGFLGTPRFEPLNIILEPGQILKSVHFELMPASIVTGRVLDENRLPVEGATAVGLRVTYDNGHRILLPPGAQADWWPGSADTPQGTEGVTDDLGEYRLPGLEPGEYYISVWRGLTRQVQGSIVPTQYYPGTADVGTAVPLVLRPGGSLGGIDINLVPQTLHTIRFRIANPECLLQLGGFLTAIPFFHVVRQSTNGISVTQAVIGGLGSGLPHSTDNHFRQLDDKSWVSPPMQPGTYDVYNAPCYLPNGSPSVGSLRFTIAEKDEREIDIGTLVVKRSVPIQGRVSLGESLSQFPKEAIPVRLVDLENRSPYLLPSRRFISPRSTIASNGAFSLDWISQGRYTLDLTPLPPDLYVASVRFQGRDVRDTGFELDGSDPGPIEIVLDGPGGMVEGVVRDPRKEPVKGAQVVLIPAPTRRSNINLFKTASTDDSGKFSLRGISPGEYGILAWEELQKGAHLDPEFLKGFETRAAKVRVERGILIPVELIVLSTVK